MNQLPINLTLYYPTYQQFENYLGFCALLSIALLIHYVFYWIAFAVKRPNLDGIVASALLPLAVLVASVLIYIPSAAASPRVYNALVVFAFLSPLLGLYVFSYFGLLG